MIVGRQDVIEKLMAALIAKGHVLLEDVPGTGKTMLSKSLAKSVDCRFTRIQFTPDLMPSDITGVSVYQPSTGEFVPAGAGVYQYPARRRNQPRHAAHAIGACWSAWRSGR